MSDPTPFSESSYHTCPVLEPRNDNTFPHGSAWASATSLYTYQWRFFRCCRKCTCEFVQKRSTKTHISYDKTKATVPLLSVENRFLPDSYCSTRPPWVFGNPLLHHNLQQLPLIPTHRRKTTKSKNDKWLWLNLSWPFPSKWICSVKQDGNAN